jgi:hypothetical protein
MSKLWTIIVSIGMAIGVLAIGAASLVFYTGMPLRSTADGPSQSVQTPAPNEESNGSNHRSPTQRSPVQAVTTRDAASHVGATPSPSPSENPEMKLRLLVPAYFYPAGPTLDDWDRIFRGAPRAPVTVIVNPNTGPGDVVDANYLAVIHRAALGKVQTAGYVNTGYAKRAKADVQAEIERWIHFYPEIAGIFLDAQAPGVEHLDYYVALRKFVADRITRGFVITNPGTMCAEEYFSRPATDIACVFEFPEKFDLFRLPPWGGLYPGKKFAALPYGVETAEVMREYVGQAARHHLGSIYVSDGNAPNPWGRLPRYWEAEVDAVHRVNQRQAP